MVPYAVFYCWPFVRVKGRDCPLVMAESDVHAVGMDFDERNAEKDATASGWHGTQQLFQCRSIMHSERAVWHADNASAWR